MSTGAFFRLLCVLVVFNISAEGGSIGSHNDETDDTEFYTYTDDTTDDTHDTDTDTDQLDLNDPKSFLLSFISLVYPSAGSTSLGETDILLMWSYVGEGSAVRGGGGIFFRPPSAAKNSQFC